MFREAPLMQQGRQEKAICYLSVYAMFMSTLMTGKTEIIS